MATKIRAAQARIDKGMYWDRALSLVEGCSKVSPGCDHCWSESQAAMRQNNPAVAHRHEDTLFPNGHWNGALNLMWEDIRKPTNRQRPAVWSVWNDLFHPAVPEGFITQAIEHMTRCSNHAFIICTKRASRAAEVMPSVWREVDTFADNKPAPNIIGMVTAENQAMADQRIPLLLKTPWAIRGVSVEPMLGPVDLSKYLLPYCPTHDFHSGFCVGDCPDRLPGLGWAICGGESGPGARPMHPDWARGLRDQCQAAGVPFFFKQWGEYGTDFYLASTGESVFRQFDTFQQWVNKAPTWAAGAKCVDMDGKPCIRGENFKTAKYPVAIMHRIGKKKAGRLLDGRTWDQYPEAS